MITPVVTLLPGAHARWERSGTIDDVGRIAQAADELGYDFLTCSEHIAVPADVATTRGARYWDPLATLGYLAALTKRIRLAPFVIVLGYHHPLAIVKRYGTLDQVSGGRLVLGVGVGSLVEEFELLGAPFEGRGMRADESLRVLRATLSTREATSYRGVYDAWTELVVEPAALQTHVPIWVGGRTGRSLRRAVELADGWAPFGLSPEEAAGLVGAARSSAAWDARNRPIDIVLQSRRAFDPLDRRDDAAAEIEALQAAGATMVAVRLVHRSPDHYIEQLAAMAALTADVTGPAAGA